MAYTTIKKPSDYFQTELWSAVDTSIDTLNFQPDFAWIKSRTNADTHVLFDAVRGANKRLSSDGTTAESTTADELTAFNSNGYTLGTGANVNRSGHNYVSWNWLGSNTTASNTDGSITSTVSANTTSGFSIVSYTGIGSAATVGHGLGAIPKMIITKNRNGPDSWSIYHAGIASDAETDVIYFETGAAFDNATFWNDTAPTSSVFSVGSASSANPFIAYCFAEKQGFSKFGSYVGNGSSTDGTFIYTGFKPAFVMMKRSDTTGNWIMFDTKRADVQGANVNDSSLYPNLTNVEGNSNHLDLLSNGFKLYTTGTDNNASGGTYIYMAFAEEPLVGDNPATAR